MSDVLTINSDRKMPLGTWVWQVSSHLEDLDRLLSFFKINNVTEAYYSVNNDVSDDEYAALIEQTAAVGVRSAALSGDAYWILPEYKSYYESFLDRTEQINRMCKGDARFYSIHMDVEPHVLPQAKENGLSEYIPGFVELIEDARKRADRMGLLLEWDIPAWICMHSDRKNDCSITETVFRYCDAVSIMAYRDFAQGQISITIPNIEFAQKYDRPLIVGCETIQLEEGLRPDGNCSITYFEEGREYMYHELAIVKNELLKEYDNIGFAIHSAEGWMALKD